VEGGGGAGAGLDRTDFALLACDNTRVYVSYDGGRTWGETAASSGADFAAGVPKIACNLGYPDKAFAYVKDDDGAYDIRASVDAGATWASVAAFTGFSGTNDILMMAGDYAGKYLLICPGQASYADAMFYYNGTSWSSRITPTGLLNVVPLITGVAGGLNSKFYVADDSGFSIAESADGGATWSEYVDVSTLTGGYASALSIHPDLGMLFYADAELWFSADALSAPAAVTGSAALFAAQGTTGECKGIFCGPDFWTVLTEGAEVNSTRLYWTDGATIELAGNFAFDGTASRPTAGLYAGLTRYARGFWDGQKMVIYVEAWTGTDPGITALSSADGKMWAVSPVSNILPTVAAQSLGAIALI
jgi:hypothetical protein